MAKPQRVVCIAIEEAQSALTILDTELSERLHADDRKHLDGLVERAKKALDKAQLHLSDLTREAQHALERI